MTSIMTHTGRLIDPFRITSYDFTSKDFAHPLSLLNRYTGHTKRPYSVAEHSVRLSLAVPDKLKRAAVLHDFNEALTNDLPFPFKSNLPDFVRFETMVQRHIFDIFDEPWENMVALHEYDRRICVNEMKVLFDVPCGPKLEPLDIDISEEDYGWKYWRYRLQKQCSELGLR